MNRRLRVLCVLGILSLTITTTALAQSRDKDKSAQRISVPFAFTAGNFTFPAGTYRLEKPIGAPGETDQVGILVLRHLEGGTYHAMVTDVSTRQGKAEAKLVFTLCHGRHYLSEVWEVGKSSGMKLRTPEATPQTAQNEPNETVALLF